MSKVPPASDSGNQKRGANVVWNVRLETSTIQGKQQKKSGGVEVLAYGTAMKATSG
jgi:uncharacterized protein YbjQ (UPF0145 family)